jgi:hypothetical protein
MNKVEKLFQDKALMRGEMMLFSKENALLFIKTCEKNNITILGIDAFILIGEKIQPSMENSIDFTSNHFKPRFNSAYSEAIDFLKNKNDKLYFEITCQD